MARTKQATPLRRETSSEYFSKADRPGNLSTRQNGATNGNAVETLEKKLEGYTNEVVKTLAPEAPKEAGALQFFIAVGGIYGSFLTWALLQERLTTTPYGPPSSPALFKFPVFLNTIQSLFAASVGYLYLHISTPSNKPTAPIFPSRRILPPLLLVALTSSLASPFGYASLAHIDYITFILAKSCKLLPVMFLHITLFQKRYPLYKYLVVLAVTSGVAVFTLHASSGKKSHSKNRAVNPDRNPAWGLLLLGINLLFDGLTNTTQDHIFQTFQPYTGPQMMCANNIMSTLITTSFLLLSPTIATTPLGSYLGMSASSAGELGGALAFMRLYPQVWFDVLGFAACGAVGQVFIFYTLSTFSSLLLVTITVTRKMLTMILSVFAFGHRLGGRQWVGVGLVFGGVGAEGWITRREKKAKEEAKRKGRETVGRKEL